MKPWAKWLGLERDLLFNLSLVIDTAHYALSLILVGSGIDEIV